MRPDVIDTDEWNTKSLSIALCEADTDKKRSKKPWTRSDGNSIKFLVRNTSLAKRSLNDLLYPFRVKPLQVLYHPFSGHHSSL